VGPLSYCVDHVIILMVDIMPLAIRAPVHRLDQRAELGHRHPRPTPHEVQHLEHRRARHRRRADLQLLARSPPRPIEQDLRRPRGRGVGAPLDNVRQPRDGQRGALPRELPHLVVQDGPPAHVRVIAHQEAPIGSAVGAAGARARLGARDIRPRDGHAGHAFLAESGPPPALTLPRLHALLWRHAPSLSEAAQAEMR
jgi:hypothetical protein